MSASPATRPRRLLAAALAAGALVGAAAVPAAAHDDDRHGHRGRHSSIVIGDIQHDSRGRDNRALNREWVEVKNTGRNAVNLRGFTLTDRQGNRYRFDHLYLDGRSSVKVHTGSGHDTHRDVYQDRHHKIWDERDTATLRDNRGNVIDTESWGRRGHHDNHRR
ncbi:lamin tail domain-containing protein [Streptomyces avidinii]|uniref:lamin tail domain-containing protein n=1 Tax=Streptomyces avidinii TaxID=1895 RepID=UPI0037B92973